MLLSLEIHCLVLLCISKPVLHCSTSQNQEIQFGSDYLLSRTCFLSYSPHLCQCYHSRPPSRRVSWFSSYFPALVSQTCSFFCHSPPEHECLLGFSPGFSSCHPQWSPLMNSLKPVSPAQVPSPLCLELYSSFLPSVTPSLLTTGSFCVLQQYVPGHPLWRSGDHP